MAVKITKPSSKKKQGEYLWRILNALMGFKPTPVNKTRRDAE